MRKRISRSLENKSKLAMHGVFWSAITVVTPIVISSLVFVLTSRLLSPADFGVVALAGAIAAGASAFIPAGFGEALVQRREVNDLDLDSVFWLCNTVGIVIYALVVLVAYPAASFFRAPVIIAVLPVVGLRVVIDTLGVVPTALITRSMSFQLTALRSFLASLASAVLSIGLVLAGFGLWALVASTIASSFVATTSMFLSAGWWPRLRFNAHAVRQLSGYAAYTTGTRIMTYVGGQADQTVVGFVLGTFDLGLYNFARRVFGIVSDVTTGALSNVVHPLFSGVQDDLTRVRRGFLTATFLSSVVAFPSFIGLACIADILVPVCFGQKWLGAVPQIRVLCAGGLIYCIGVLQAGLINSLGKPGWWFKYQFGVNCLNVPIILLLASHGVTVMLMAITLKAYVFWCIPVIMTLRLLSLSGWAYFLQFTSPLLAVVAMASTVLLTRSSFTDLRPAFALIADIAIGLASYGIVLLLLSRQRLLGILSILRSATRRNAV